MCVDSEIATWEKTEKEKISSERMNNYKRSISITRTRCRKGGDSEMKVSGEEQ